VDNLGREPHDNHHQAIPVSDNHQTMLKLPHKHLIFPTIKVFLFGEFFPGVFSNFVISKLW
jgi:hypothetical protein